MARLYTGSRAPAGTLRGADPQHHADCGPLLAMAVMVRRGKCDGCKRPGLTAGQCCTYLLLRLARVPSADEKKWIELHEGLKVLNGAMLRIDTACSALTEGGDCALFGTEDRPDLCKLYPIAPEHMPDGCAYEFSNA